VSDNEVVVDPGQQLVGIETPYYPGDFVDTRVSDCRMRVSETVADLRRIELIDDVDIFAEAEC
jgi:hypothetical protein